MYVFGVMANALVRCWSKRSRIPNRRLFQQNQKCPTLYYKLDRACFLKKKSFSRKYNPLMVKNSGSVAQKRMFGFENFNGPQIESQIRKARMQEIRNIAVEAPDLNIEHSIPACRETPKVLTSMLDVRCWMFSPRLPFSVSPPPLPA